MAEDTYEKALRAVRTNPIRSFLFSFQAMNDRNKAVTKLLLWGREAGLVKRKVKKNSRGEKIIFFEIDPRLEPLLEEQLAVGGATYIARQDITTQAFMAAEAEIIEED